MKNISIKKLKYEIYFKIFEKLLNVKKNLYYLRFI